MLAAARCALFILSLYQSVDRVPNCADVQMGHIGNPCVIVVTKCGMMDSLERFVDNTPLNSHNTVSLVDVIRPCNGSNFRNTNARNLHKIISKSCRRPCEAKPSYCFSAEAIILSLDNTVASNSSVPFRSRIYIFQCSSLQFRGLSSTVNIRYRALNQCSDRAFNYGCIRRSNPSPLACNQRSTGSFSLLFGCFPLSFGGRSEVGVARDELVSPCVSRFHFRQLTADVDYVNDRRQSDNDRRSGGNNPVMYIEKENKTLNRSAYKTLSIILDFSSFPVGYFFLAWGGGAILTWRNCRGLSAGCIAIIVGCLCIGHAIWHLSH